MVERMGREVGREGDERQRQSEKRVGGRGARERGGKKQR